MNTQEPITIRGFFGRINPATKEEALEYARFNFREIRTRQSDTVKLAIVNSKLTGIQFALEELTA